MKEVLPETGRAVLSPERRRESLDAIAHTTIDVVVVGGGITGAGVALDAVTRGCSVALLEADDWAAGTSSRSSKLIHGGLRYLEQLHFGLVREALRERSLLLERLAPHLVRPVPFLFPLRHRAWERAYVGAGLRLYDAFAGVVDVPGDARIAPHRHLGRREALAAAPGLRDAGLRGGLVYYDAQVDDARYALEVVRTAAAYGALVATRARVVGFLGDKNGVRGVAVRDEESGTEFEVRARSVICAGGIWTAQLQSVAGVSDGLRVRRSKGVHLVLPRARLPLDTGLIVRSGKSVLLVIPWGRHWIVGTTDTEWTLESNEPVATAADVGYLLDRLNAEFAVAISEADIVATYAGLRPLLKGRAASTARLGREHAVVRPRPGLTVVAGGKYTTYRVMAADAVDLALADLGRVSPASETAAIPLLGAARSDEDGSLTNVVRRVGLAPQSLERLKARYGALASEVVAVMAGDATMAEPIPGAEDYLLAEARYACSHEGALGLGDVLARRTRIAIEYSDRGGSAAAAVAGALAPVLGWSADDVAREVDEYRRRAAAQRAAESAPDDASAEAELASAGAIGE